MKTKTILVLILTLFIGFVLGMLTSAQIRHSKLRPVKVFFSEERFREGFYHTIKPDDRQKAEIDPILDKYARINTEIQSKFRKEMDASMKNFRKEIDAKLTKDQIARLKEMDQKRQEMIKNRRKHHRDTSNTRYIRKAGDSLRYNYDRNTSAPDSGSSDNK
jgi:hypothetical protein